MYIDLTNGRICLYMHTYIHTYIHTQAHSFISGTVTRLRSFLNPLPDCFNGKELDELANCLAHFT